MSQKRLREDKEKILSENEKSEKQQKRLQQEMYKMVQPKEVMERIKERCKNVIVCMRNRVA